MPEHDPKARDKQIVSIPYGEEVGLQPTKDDSSAGGNAGVSIPYGEEVGLQQLLDTLLSAVKKEPVFQSPTGKRSGCNSTSVAATSWWFSCFNPLRGRGRVATVPISKMWRITEIERVSIPYGEEVGLQLDLDTATTAFLLGRFNPLRGRGRVATQGALLLLQNHWERFQSPTGKRSGCN